MEMSKIVKIAVIGFLFGVAFELLAHAGFYFAVLALFAAFAFYILSAPQKKIIVSIALVFFALGVLRAGFAPVRTDSVFFGLLDGRVRLEGVIVNEPDIRENAAFLTVRVDGEDLLVVAKKYPEFAYGDRIKIFGKISSPENIVSDTGREFDYISYLAKDGIFFEMAFPEIKVVSHNEGSPLTAFLLSVKHGFISRVSRVIPEPEAGLLGGVLLGMKHSVSAELLQDFRTAGIIHVVVLSGYNITLVAEFFMMMLAGLPKIVGQVFGAFGIILFVLMTGAGASTLRAAVMSLCVIFARATGRTEDSLHLLFVAAFTMILWNPMLLLYDPSFQLSFLATLGLFVGSSRVSRSLHWISPKWGLRETVAATLSTQILVLPLLLYQTGMFSVVALPVNVLVLPCIPFAMLFGFLTGVFAFAFPPLASLVGALAFLLLSYVVGIAELFAKLPFAAITLPAFSLFFVIVAYILCAAFFAKDPPRGGS